MQTNPRDHAFRDLIYATMDQGEWRGNRTSQDALSAFGHYMTFDLRKGFPLVTEKEMPFKSIIAELVGFIRGYSSAAQFRELGTNIWNANANHPGTADKPNSWLLSNFRRGEDDLGRIYGVQWRDYRSIQFFPSGEGLSEKITSGQAGDFADVEWADTLSYGPGYYAQRRIDQLRNLLNGLVHDPFGRRHLVSAWNPGEMDQMALPPCHILFQCYVTKDRHIDLQMYQRSADVFLGIPFNIASYAAMLHWIAKMTGYQPRYLKMCLGDYHIYSEAQEACMLVLDREPLPMPDLVMHTDPEADIDDVKVEDFELVGYESHPAIKDVAMAV